MSDLRAALPFPTTDAMKWVRAFREAFPDVNVDDGTMLGWFANAIEHGRGPDGPAVPEALDRCPVCGTPGSLVSSDEGTSHFRPAASATDEPTQPCDCDTIPRRLRDRRSRADGHAYDCPPHYRSEPIPPRHAASACPHRCGNPACSNPDHWTMTNLGTKETKHYDR